MHASVQHSPSWVCAEKLGLLLPHHTPKVVANMANMVPRLLGRRPAVRRKPLNHGHAHLPGHSPVGSVLAHAWRRRRAFGRRTSRSEEDLQRKSEGASLVYGKDHGYSNHSDSVGINGYNNIFWPVFGSEVLAKLEKIDET